MVISCNYCKVILRFGIGQMHFAPNTLCAVEFEERLMADEESEIRRMAEIADAINAILDANPVGDTPSQRVAPPQADTATDNAVTPKDGDDDLPVDLDAAIAAELGNDAGDDFGPVPDIDFGADAPVNNEIGREVNANSHMADLSLRMQDTLAEISTGNIIHGTDNQEMLAQMEAARDAVVGAMREKIDQINAETASRKQTILEQMQQLESQNSLLRDEMEIQILKFEDDLKDMQKKYLENAVTDSDRLDRYREFLKYLLTERGTKLD